MMLLNLFIKLLSASETEKFTNLDKKMELSDQGTLRFGFNTSRADVFDSLNKFRPGGIQELRAPEVKKLDLSFVQSTMIPSGLGITFPNLEELDLYGNFYLETLDKNAFKGMKNLKKLSLGICVIKELPSGIFDELVNLTTLDLGSNKLSALNEKIFNGLKNLEDLDLKSNELKSLPEDIFNGLKKLKTLKLDGNQLNELNEKLFKPLVNLKKLYLGNNDLKPLPIELFENLKKKGLEFLSVGDDMTENYYNEKPQQSSYGTNTENHQQQQSEKTPENQQQQSGLNTGNQQQQSGLNTRNQQQQESGTNTRNQQQLQSNKTPENQQQQLDKTPEKGNSNYIVIGILILVVLGGLVFMFTKTSQSPENSN